jgi:hypothetical protein
MPDQHRVQATVEKARRGGLPSSAHQEPAITLGDGRPCDGCAETIHPTELLFTVTANGGVEIRFHDVCFHAWNDAQGHHQRELDRR